MLAEGRPLSKLARMMTVFPQVLLNVAVSRKPDLAGLPEVQAAIAAAGRQLGERGRVLVRYSGTQMQCRVMVEGPNPLEIDTLARRIAAVLALSLAP
jgi:phosphoglucosamine mutase